MSPFAQLAPSSYTIMYAQNILKLANTFLFQEVDFFSSKFFISALDSSYETNFMSRRKVLICWQDPTNL